MERKGISIKEFSEKAHISVPTLNRYIKGLHTPSHFPAGKMAIVLEVFPDWLRGLDVPMENARFDDEIYSERDTILKRILEDAELENIVNILMEMPPDKLKAVKEILLNMEEIVS